MEERAILCFANCLKSQPQPFEDLFISCFSLVESVSYLTNVIYVLAKSQWCGLISKLNSFGGLDHRKGRNQRWISLTSEDSWDWPCSQLVSVQRKTFDCSLAGKSISSQFEDMLQIKINLQHVFKSVIIPIGWVWIDWKTCSHLITTYNCYARKISSNIFYIRQQCCHNVRHNIKHDSWRRGMSYNDQCIVKFDTWPKTAAKDKRVFWELAIFRFDFYQICSYSQIRLKAQPFI